MKTIPSDKAAADLSGLIGQISLSHEPIKIHSATGTAVLLAEGDWCSIQETLHLVSVPRMHESICEGISTPIEDCSGEPNW